MAVGSMLTKIPWKGILTNAPVIAEMAKKIYDRIKSKGGSRHLPDIQTKLFDLSLRLDKVENGAKDQAVLIKQMAEQLRQITLTLSVLSARLTFLFWSLLLVFLLALTGLLLVILR